MTLLTLSQLFMSLKFQDYKVCCCHEYGFSHTLATYLRYSTLSIPVSCADRATCNLQGRLNARCMHMQQPDSSRPDCLHGPPIVSLRCLRVLLNTISMRRGRCHRCHLAPLGRVSGRESSAIWIYVRLSTVSSF